MKFEFDSLSELEQFLMFSAHIGRAFATAPAPEQVAMSANVPSELRTEIDKAPGVAAVIAAQEEAEKPTRKRRTKAEIEAERAAEVPVGASVPDVTVAPAETAAEQVAEPAPQGNPFAAAPAMQAILDAPNQGAATLAAMAALNAPVVELKPIESIDHLRACQAFIQKHGMTKYNESFGGALSPNIAAYTPEQRSEHVAKLEALGA